jgi:hypothetical protein
MYDGPLYRQGRKVEDNFQMFTTASSIEKARANFIYKAGKGCDILYNCINELEPTWEEEHPDRVCPNCNNLLMDNGQCPLCDNSDYCIMDDIKLLKDIDDGDYSDY